MSGCLNDRGLRIIVKKRGSSKRKPDIGIEVAEGIEMVFTFSKVEYVSHNTRYEGNSLNILLNPHCVCIDSDLVSEQGKLYI